MAKSNNVGYSRNNNCKNEIIKRLPFIFKSLDKAINYLILNDTQTLSQLKKAFIKVLIFLPFNLECYN